MRRAAIVMMVMASALVGGSGGAAADEAPTPTPAAPPNRPGTFGGSPAGWLETTAGGVWMQQGSTCWSTMTPGGTVGGCADTVGFSCANAAIPGAVTKAVTVRPGELLRFHADGATVRVEGLSLDPRDVALRPVEHHIAPTDAEPSNVRAPDVEAVIHVFVRGVDGGGDSSYGLCLRPTGEPHDGEVPTQLSTRVDVVETRAAAEYLAREELGAGGRVTRVPGSVHCASRIITTLSSHALWRCAGVATPQGGGMPYQWRSTVVRPGTSLQYSSVAVRPLALRGASTSKVRGLVAIRGALVLAQGRTWLCRPVPSSAPPSCTRDRILVRGLVPGDYDLIRIHAVRFGADPVSLVGTIRAGTLVLARP